MKEFWMQNLEWIIGTIISVAGLAIAYLTYKWTIQNPEKEKKKNQPTQDNSNNKGVIFNKEVTFHGPVKFNHIINNSEDAIKQIVNNKLDEAIVSGRLASKEEYERNVENFKNAFYQILLSNPLANMQKFKSIDFQMDLTKAVEVAARIDNPKLHLILAELLSIKMDNIDNDTMNSILTESILVMGKLNLNQLKILTFSFMLLEYVFKVEIASWSHYNKYFEENVKPFMDFENKEIDFKHLEYVGCVKIDLGFAPPRLSSILHNQNPKLFPNATNLTSNVPYNNKTVAENFSDAPKVEEILLRNSIWGVATTSVGIMLASIYYEKITGSPLSKLNLFF